MKIAKSLSHSSHTAFILSTLIALISIFLLETARANLTRDLQSATLLQEDYLLDSDLTNPADNRHTAKTDFSAFFQITNLTLSHNGTYRVAYRLQDSNGVSVDLVNGDPSDLTVAYTDSVSVNLSQFAIFPNVPVSSQSVTFSALPDPVPTLDPKLEYQVTGTLQTFNGVTWSNVLNGISPFLFNEIETTASTPYLHFTNTTSGDPEFNTRARISSLTWNRTHALATDSNLDRFTATAEVVATRWDEFLSAINFRNIDFSVDFDLIEVGSGTSIPLENDGINTYSISRASHTLFAPFDPLSPLTTTVNAEIKPLVQLASAGETYILRCTVSHEEDALGTQYVDTVCELPAEQLLHFNGNLFFGSLRTTFDQISNTPIIGAGTTTSAVQTSINIPNGNGSIPNRPGYGFGNNTALSIQLENDGDAILTAGTQAVFQPASPGATLECDHGGVSVTYGSIILSTSGATGNLTRVNFPQGLTLMRNIVVNPFMGENGITQTGGTTLDDHLCPLNSLTFGFINDAEVADESHPIRYKVDQLTVDPGVLKFNSSEARYIHQKAFESLKDLVGNGFIPPAEAQRKSNDRYLLDVQIDSSSVVFQVASDRTSRVNSSVIVNSQEFQPHFPSQASVRYGDASPMLLDEGVIVPGSSLRSAQFVRLSYYQTCPEDTCTASVPPVTIEQKPDGNEIFLVPGGGLHSPGDVSAGQADLQWGFRAPGRYAHRTDTFSRTSFYMPGYQLYAEDNVLVPGGPLSLGSGDEAAATLLLSGFNRDVSNPDLHLSTEPEYTDGDGDLPGLNFDVDSNNFDGASRLAGDLNDYKYELLPGGAKYYIRLAGVSGRQVATDGTFDNNLVLHGFPCEITQFQLSFLDSTNTAPGTTSWVDGNVKTTGPYSAWDQTFTGLRFDCLGEPGEMTPDSGSSDNKPMDYWLSSFDLKTIRFAKDEVNPGTCPKEYTAKLLVGAKTEVAHISQPLYGALAFCPDGNLSTAANPIEGYDSQLNIPVNIPLDGPNKDYNLVTVSKLRFNNPTASGAPPTGFVTFAATIDIPYFVDLQVQAITSAVPGNISPFYLTPGWDSGGNTFFNQIDFDPGHRGFPSAGISFNEFRAPNENTADTYLIKAEQKLFHLIDLRYPLKWDDTVRRFSSMSSQKQELFITQVEHQIEWMDAKFANISFGAEYDGIPQLKLSNYLNDQIDEAANVISTQFNALAKKAVDTAIAQMDKMLEDSLEAVIDPVIDAAEAPLTDLHGAVVDLANQAINLNTDYATFRSQVEQTLTNPASILYNDEVLQPLLTELCKMNATVGEAQSFIVQLDQALQDVVKGIDAIVQGVEIVNGEVQFQNILPTAGDITGAGSNYVRGLLFKEAGGERNIISNVVDALLRQYIEPELQAVIQPLLDDLNSELNKEINGLLDTLNPTLDQIRTALLKVREVVVDIRSKVAVAGDITARINDIITDAKSPTGTFGTAINQVGMRAWARYQQLEASLGISAASTAISDVEDFLANFTADDFIQLLKDELKAAILESEVVKRMQFIVRQSLYDVQDRITSSVQSVLAEMSTVLKEVVSSTVGELEEKINPLIGKVNQYMGSGEITGYAEVNGDSLRKLRLDAKMQLEMPEEMSLHVYLEILAYNSEDNFVESGCIEPGEKAVEVRIGAQDVAIEWVSDIRVNFEVKMTLKDEVGDSFDFPVPNGVGGKFEMTDGTLEFQTFEILEFGATIAVGFDETYLGAKARARFSGYEVAAALFFGRTCTLEPLLFVDPDIGDVVTAGTTFTGAYVYGDVWLPISELVLGIPASCLFRIDAGVGAGAFYFVEGPTYGGKMFLGVSGEALCLVSIRGEVKMILASQAGNMRGAGTGKFSAKIGPCPFCIKFRKSVKIKYDNGDWAID